MSQKLEERPPAALPQHPMLLGVDGAGVGGELEEALEADGQVGDDVGRPAVGVGADGHLSERLEAGLDALGISLAIGAASSLRRSAVSSSSATTAILA
jgi:hypothetical protein